jgi:NAD(P)-dependent dehydrogenase (short-subunit alcohol dehydrogenase family)
MRLQGKIAIVIGAGQTPGPTVGNGRATALLFAREGATVLAVDRDLESARETVELIGAEGGEAIPCQADVTDEASLRAAIDDCVANWGRVDVLHNNVGISVTGGDAAVTEITTEAFDRVMAVNLRGTVMACKHALPHMRRQGSGAIVNISSIAAVENYSVGRLQSEQSGHGGFHPPTCHSECRVWRACQRDIARLDGYPHGGR